MRRMERSSFFLRIYIVQKGDTLHKIAKKHHIPMEEVIRLNTHISNPEYILPGMKIKLPNRVSKKSEMEKEVNEELKSNKKLEAETNRRPLGSVAEMDDRGMNDVKDRIALKNHNHFAIQKPNKANEKQMKTKLKQDYEQNKQIKSPAKTYSNKQYRHAEHYRPGPVEQFTQFHNPYDTNYQGPQEGHMNDHFAGNYPNTPHFMPAQQHYCPCCMYHWHMQQSMRYQYKADEKHIDPNRRRYY